MAKRTTTNPTTGRTIGKAKEQDGKLTTAGRLALDRKAFALPPGPEEKARGEKGRYPIPDETHARAALSRVAANGTEAEQKKVVAAVKRKFPAIQHKKG